MWFISLRVALYLPGPPKSLSELSVKSSSAPDSWGRVEDSGELELT